MSKFDTPRTADDSTERDEILDMLADTMETTHTHIEESDWETEDEQELAIKWIRAFGYLSGQYRKLMKDTDIDEMEDELALVKTAANLEDDT